MPAVKSGAISDMLAAKFKLLALTPAAIDGSERGQCEQSRSDVSRVFWDIGALDANIYFLWFMNPQIGWENGSSVMLRYFLCRQVVS